MKKHSVDGSKGRLVFTVFTPESQTKEVCPAFIVARGWPSPQDNGYDLAQRFSDMLDCVVVTFDFGGIGQSEGELENFSIKDHVEDQSIVIDAVKDLKIVDSERVVLHCNSYSAYTSPLAVETSPVKALLVRAPAQYPDEAYDKAGMQTADNHHEEYRSSAIESNISLEALNRFTGEIILIQHELDELIPNSQVEVMLNKMQSSKEVTHQIIEGAKHHLDGMDEIKRNEKVMADWLRKVM